MPTPSLQTLVTDAKAVLALQNMTTIRSTMAVALANANTGTPLNPGLTSQQLINEVRQVITLPKSDIESIIVNQLMKFLNSPPAPGGVGADKQVIWNDAGVLTGDPNFTWDGPSSRLTVSNATITGDLTVDTSTLKVNSSANQVGVGITTFTGTQSLQVLTGLRVSDANPESLNCLNLAVTSTTSTIETRYGTPLIFGTNATECYRISSTGVATWSNVGGVAGTAMTLNANGLGIGVTPSAWSGVKAIDVGSSGGSFYGFSAAAGVTGNAYFDGSVYKYKSTNPACHYQQAIGPGTHAWYTAPSGTAGTAITFTQAMTLDASGNLLVGTTTTNFTNTNGVVVAQSSDATYASIGHSTGTATGAYYCSFGYNGTQIGSITQNGTTGVLYNITSDYRLKEQVQPLIGGLARVNALKPSVYKWKSDGSNGEGFLAHELAEVVPFAVSGEKDAVNEDGSIKSQGIDMSRVVPILVAAIQELTARVQTLETR